MNNIDSSLRNSEWLPANNIQRDFVRYKNPKDSPGKIWKFSAENKPIKVSVIIPTVDAYRDGYFQKLISQLNNQSFILSKEFLKISTVISTRYRNGGVHEQIVTYDICKEAFENILMKENNYLKQLANI